MCQACDGGFAAVGNVFVREGGDVTTSSDIVVIRTDARGQQVWSRTLNGAGFAQGSSIEATKDGGFIIAGHTSPDLSLNPSLFLIKMDAYGSAVWERTYGDFGTYVGKSAVQTHDGGYIISGWVKKKTGMNPDLLLLRTDSSGDVVWEEQIGDAGSEEGNAVIETADGGFLVVGRTDSFGAGDNDMYVVKTDSAGSVLWERAYGSTSYDAAEDVQEISGSGYVITGQTTTPVDRMYPQQSIHTSSVYLIRTDMSGNSLWEHSLGDSKWNSLGHSVDLTPDGGFVVAGQRKSDRDDWEMYMLRTNGEGLPVWEYSWGGEGFDLASSVVRTDDGGYIMAGGRTVRNETETGLDVVMARFVSDGKPSDSPPAETILPTTTPVMTEYPAQNPPPVLWEQTCAIGSGACASDIVRTQDGGFVISGTTMVENRSVVYGPPFPYDAFLIKTDGSGHVVWNRTFGGESGDGANAVRETADGGFIVAGHTSRPSHHDSDMYLVRTDSSGKILWERVFGGAGLDALYGVCETGDGGFMVAGESDQFQSYGVATVYLARTDPVGEIVWEQQYPGILSGGARSLESVSDGGCIIGAFMDPALIRTDDAGRKVWAVNYQEVAVSSVIPTRDGGFIGTGSGVSHKTGNVALALFRVDGAGKTEWEIFSPEKMSSGQRVEETKDGGFVAIGSCSVSKKGECGHSSFSNGIYLMKTGSDGVLLWEKRLEPAAFSDGVGVLPMPDNSYIVLGTIAPEGGSESVYCSDTMPGRVYIAKLSADEVRQGS